MAPSSQPPPYLAAGGAVEADHQLGHQLTLGFQTTGDESPVHALDLLETARESAEQFRRPEDTPRPATQQELIGRRSRLAHWYEEFLLWGEYVAIPLKERPIR